MSTRRAFLELAIPAFAGSLARRPAAPPEQVKRLVFVHGRSQHGKNPDVLKREWMEALARGAARLGRVVPSDVEVAFPYYGDKLDSLVSQLEVPLTTDIQARGGMTVNSEFLAFQAAVAEDLRRAAQVSDNEIEHEYGLNPTPKGPQNWEWVQAILRALDKHTNGVSQAALEALTRDVFLYTRRAGVRDEIDSIVDRDIPREPAVVVGHSLGSVVAYSVLRSSAQGAADVPLLLTLGSPLGVRSIRNEFRPLRFPGPVRTWYNAYDERDVVALFPLDTSSFPVQPAIENYGMVDNRTENRHGIVGYLEDPVVAGRILGAIT